MDGTLLPQLNDKLFLLGSFAIRPYLLSVKSNVCCRPAAAGQGLLREQLRAVPLPHQDEPLDPRPLQLRHQGLRGILRPVLLHPGLHQRQPALARLRQVPHLLPAQEAGLEARELLRPREIRRVLRGRQQPVQ